MDSFHNYLKKQLLDYVEEERKKGIPLDEIEKVLLDAGHRKNIIDEVFLELEKAQAGQKIEPQKNEVEKDMTSMLKGAFSKFMSQASQKEVKEAKQDFANTDTKEIVKEVIDEAEIIEEKTMLESATFFIYLVFLTLIVLFSAGSSDSQILSVIIGFLPVIISVFASFLMLSIADNVPMYMFIPLVISSIFYAIVKFTAFPLFQGMDAEGLSIVNFLLGFFFNVLIVYMRFIKPNHMRRRVIKRQPRDYSSINQLRQ